MFSASSVKKSTVRSNAASVTGNGKSLAPPGSKSVMPAPSQPLARETEILKKHEEASITEPVLQGVFGEPAAKQVVGKLKKRYPTIIKEGKEAELTTLFTEMNDLDEVLDHIYDMMGKNQVLNKIKKKDAEDYNIQARLASAQAAIAHAKTVFKWGAGNQVEAQHISEGNAGVRSNFAKQISPIQRPETAGDHIKKIEHDNTAAGLTKGGTCAQYAAVVFEFLKAQNIRPLTMVTKADHTFVIIGDFERENANTLVVADAWPSVAQALLLSDHFSGGKDGLAPKATHPTAASSDLEVSVDEDELEDENLDAENRKNFLAEAATEIAPTGHAGLSLVHYGIEKDTGGYDLLDNLDIHFDQP